jgi:hypothetical protein
VLRYLKELGYHTSYNFNSRYYTLEGIPEFDVDGLWDCQGVLFSCHGTLRETVRCLVEASRSGITGAELAAKLHVRLDSLLRRFVEEGDIARESTKRGFLYLPVVGRA